VLRWVWLSKRNPDQVANQFTRCAVDHARLGKDLVGCRSPLWVVEDMLAMRMSLTTQGGGGGRSERSDGHLVGRNTAGDIDQRGPTDRIQEDHRTLVACPSQSDPAN